MLEMDEESGFKISETLGFTDEASRRIKTLLQEVELLFTAVQSSWRRLQSALNAYYEVSEDKNYKIKESILIGKHESNVITINTCYFSAETY